LHDEPSPFFGTAQIGERLLLNIPIFRDMGILFLPIILRQKFNQPAIPK